MIEAKDFLRAASRHGYRLYTGVPCSYLKPFINYVIEDESLRYVAAANEGDAVAIAAGSEIAGAPAICMFQNSGLGNAVSPLSSLTHTFRLPILLILTHRGQPGGSPDEPQHELMGRITTPILDVLGIPWERFPTEAADVESALDRASQSMRQSSEPFAFVMSKDSVAPWPSRAADRRDAPPPPVLEPRRTPLSTRAEMLAVIRATARRADILIATTGYTGRELYAAGDSPNQFYVVGSMGCASSFALGIALASPERRVLVIDGDGAALMRLGALSTIGSERPRNLVHAILDNGVHESTGNQFTVSDSTDLGAVAAACNYPIVQRAHTPGELTELLRDRTPELRLIHAATRTGIPDELPRPTIAPPDVAARLRAHITRTSES